MAISKYIISYHLIALLVAAHLKCSLSCGSRSGVGSKDPRKERLMLHQCVPDVIETSQMGSGPPKGKITRNSPEFEKLEPCYNTAIIFKDEEGTGADRLMSKRCKEKLIRLASLVKEQWPKLRLVVTEAWDEQGQHSTDSLHYEGRAVDLRLSDTYQSNPEIAVLGRLAVNAGFDWVKYESETHIHASVREDNYVDPPADDGCFSSDSTVKLENGAVKRIRHLKIGDSVQVMTQDGKIGYSEVMMFVDYLPDVSNVSHILIETKKPAKRITMTPSHLLFTSNSLGTELTAKQAIKVSIGEFVLVSSGGQLIPSQVANLSMVELTGMVAPVTVEGNIIVDGVLSSCYAVIDDHESAHLAFGPMRIAHNYGSRAWNVDSSTIQHGMHWYPQLLIKINNALGLFKLS
ncbi:sonic hedgehog protein-like [Montipora foliosa]|uniref:sonic hedgehog protein-like n=1 Tax=Montipora foliosa TaxID=591990 RepID=UPI0035F13324